VPDVDATGAEVGAFVGVAVVAAGAFVVLAGVDAPLPLLSLDVAVVDDELLSHSAYAAENGQSPDVSRL
jgi:hypothetical protein